MRVGVYYSKEFREYVHQETRGTIDYEVNLGPAHVTNLDWLLGAMFREIVPVDDPARVASITPPLAMVLEPRFEEYSFLTPKDVAGEAFIVTIRYLLTVYDGSGARVDSFAFTGYGREKAHTLASKEPLAIATQRAMRDAGAKVAVELTDQESVRLLLHGVGSPLPAVAAGSRPTSCSRRRPRSRRRRFRRPRASLPSSAGRSASLSRSRSRRRHRGPRANSRLRTSRPSRGLRRKNHRAANRLPLSRQPAEKPPSGT